jgi:arabinan endo-1,5-alpha-L-arabinosidase
MMKKVLCGAMAAALVASTLVSAADASAATKVPKAKYTFNMNKKSSKVVAVARKGDTSSMTTGNTDTGVLPTASQAKKIKLKYVKGKHGKALYLDRSSSYGAQLKGIKLGKKSWTVSFWVKPSSSLSSYMSVFFTGSDIVNTSKTKWVSITKTGDGWTTGYAAPAIWSHNAAADQFPWYAYQTEDGVWAGDTDDSKAMALQKDKWTYVTLVVDASDTCEYGVSGEDGYVKSYHAWTYINGKLFGNGTVAKGTMSNKNSFFLGINAWDTPFKGYYDDVQFWNKALTEKQVAKLYKSMK